ncbi:MAG: V-type ATP synthase subunit D, partial [Candidatus Poseidoniia archaeon]|nr:V-type ATP synthase subunit D [Candidatus Poseidoniia archaeon]
MSIADVKPTRSELIVTRRRIKLSISGHKLLKMKRDGLIIEFFELLPKVKDMRVQLAELYREANGKLAVAMVADGKSALSSAANCVRTPPQVKLTQRNIMGVVVPRIEVSTIQKSVEERGYGLIGTSVRVDEAVHAFEQLATKI